MGGPDIGWNNATDVHQGLWTHVAYTYDDASQTTRVYSDGIEANSEVLAAPLNTHAVDNGNRPLAFRVGSQNEADGSPTGTLRGSMTIGRIRVYDQALSAQAIAAKFDQEKTFFTSPPADVKLQEVAYDRAAGSILFKWTSAPGKTYAVELATIDWNRVVGGWPRGV